ncbi:MAG: hypothetical protein ACK4VJ_05715 [Rhodoluna sp.]|jgi:hypothetical protein
MAKNEKSNSEISGLENNVEKLADKSDNNRRLAQIAGIIAVIALLLGGWGIYNGINLARITDEVKKTCLANAKPGPKGPEGTSAYTLWLSVGNTGSLQDFLDSLIGEKGENGYTGSTGFNGPAGQDGSDGSDGANGASAYQLWLDAGNGGTPEEFLESLIGPAGIDGTDGTDGTNGTNGINGTNGVDGAAGLSAYELWVAQGNPGTEADFLASLVGADGSNGTDGTNGADGKSAYEIWLEAGNTGTEADFLASLKGADGVCTPGSGLGYFGSFFDLTTQTNDAAVNVMRYDNSDVHNDGVSIVDGSKIVIANPGTYNIQFSAQITRLSGGNSSEINIWLRQNGVNYPASDTTLTVQANAHKIVAAWNFFATTTNPNEYFEIVWASDEPSMELLYKAGNGSPDIPSVILTVNQIN